MGKKAQIRALIEENEILRASANNSRRIHGATLDALTNSERENARLLRELDQARTEPRSAYRETETEEKLNTALQERAIYERRAFNAGAEVQALRTALHEIEQVLGTAAPSFDGLARLIDARFPNPLNAEHQRPRAIRDGLTGWYVALKSVVLAAVQRADEWNRLDVEDELGDEEERQERAARWTDANEGERRQAFFTWLDRQQAGPVTPDEQYGDSDPVRETLELALALGILEEPLEDVTGIVDARIEGDTLVLTFADGASSELAREGDNFGSRPVVGYWGNPVTDPTEGRSSTAEPGGAPESLPPLPIAGSGGAGQIGPAPDPNCDCPICTFGRLLGMFRRDEKPENFGSGRKAPPEIVFLNASRLTGGPVPPRSAIWGAGIPEVLAALVQAQEEELAALSIPVQDLSNPLRIDVKELTGVPRWPFACPCCSAFLAPPEPGQTVECEYCGVHVAPDPGRRLWFLETPKEDV